MYWVETLEFSSTFISYFKIVNKTKQHGYNTGPLGKNGLMNIIECLHQRIFSCSISYT